MCTGRSPVISGTDPVAHQSQRTQECVIGLFFIVLPTRAMQALFAEQGSIWAQIAATTTDMSQTLQGHSTCRQSERP